MIWEESVLSANQLADLQIGYEEPSNESIGYERRIAQAQAKASFEAGQLSGRQEVVDAILHRFPHTKYNCQECRRKIKLQEWGIE